ncbi:MAG: hypothetical protein ABIJ04_04775 [Bacteroidota bacterium]
MKTNNLLLMMLLLSTLLWNNATGKNVAEKVDNDNDPGFVLVKDVSGIQIFTRWIPVTESRSARQIKSELVMKGTIATVLSVLRNDRSFTKWMNGTKDYYRVKTIDSSQWYSYVQFSIPWPLNNQDCIIKYEVSEDPPGGKTMIRLTGTPSYIRHFEGVTRIPHMEGSWIITNLGHNKVKVEYSMFSNQKPSFPRWITDPIIQNNLLKTMAAFHDEVKKTVSEKNIDYVTN